LNLFDLDIDRLAFAGAEGSFFEVGNHVALPARPVAALALTASLTLAILSAQIQHSAPITTLKMPAVARSVSIAPKKKAPGMASFAKIFAQEQTMSNYDLLHRWDKQIAAAAKRFDVPADWIRAVMIQESGGRTMLSATRQWISNKGALGLMQLMPDTYREISRQYGLGADPFNAEDNIRAGAAYLRWLNQRYGLSGMFAAYNAGPARLEQSVAQVTALPGETQAYVAGVARSLGLSEDALLPPELGMAFVGSHGTIVGIPQGSAPVAIDTTQIATAVTPALPQEITDDDSAWLSRREGARERRMACTSPSGWGCN
jgi:hypothetical protein